MADFTFGDILGRAVQRRISDRSQQVLDVLENPAGAFQDRANAAMGETTTATTQAASTGYVNPRFALASSSPAVPTTAATGPAAPVSTFDRLLQAESGNRDFDAQGRPVTSPKGAMFASQVMPATAANPGFGIRPAQSQTPEEYNRVGREFYQALVKKYGGDEKIAAAAYNAGPNRVDKNLAENQGYLNVDQLPRETQGYLGRIFPAPTQMAQAQRPAGTPRQPGIIERVVNAVVPSAQAGTLPATQAAPSGAVAPSIQTRPAINTEDGSVYYQEVPENERIDLTKPFSVVVPLSGTTATTAVAPTTSAVTPAAAPAPEAAPVTSGFTGQGLRGPGGESTQQQNYYTVLNSNDHKGLMALAYDLSTPPNIARMAMDRLHTDIETTRKVRKAEEDLAKFAQSQNPTQLVRAMNDKDTGSYFKAYLFNRLGLTELARQEQDKISPSLTYAPVTLANGENFSVKFNKATGQVLSAQDSAGNQITDPTKLGEIAAQGTGKKLDIVGGSYVNDQTGEVGRLVTDQRTGRSYVQTDTGMKPMTGFRPQGQGGTLDMQRVAQIQRQNIDLAGDWEKARIAIAKASPQAAAEEAGRFNFKHGTNYTPQQFTGVAPQIDLTTGQIIRPGMAAPQAAPQAAPAPSGAVSPQAAAQIPQTAAAPVQGQPSPLAGLTPQQMAASGASPAQIESELNRRKEAEKVQRELDQARQTEALKSNQTFTDSLTKNRREGTQQKATIERLQSSIAANPDFWGIDTNSTTWRAFVDINSKDSDRAEALNTFARNLNIPNARRAAFDQVMNDYRNLQVSAVTNSGLTASQTNTERESQRVMGTVGSLADRPAAARATLEYAKAKIDYVDAKARAWADVRRLNPAADYSMFELDFDRTQGEKIFEDANARMSRIINRPPIAATQTAPRPAGGTQAAPALTPADLARQELERRRRGGQ